VLVSVCTLPDRYIRGWRCFYKLADPDGLMRRLAGSNTAVLMHLQPLAGHCAPINLRS
jgi:hypothetical protein